MTRKLSNEAINDLLDTLEYVIGKEVNYINQVIIEYIEGKDGQWDDALRNKIFSVLYDGAYDGAELRLKKLRFR